MSSAHGELQRMVFCVLPDLQAADIQKRHCKINDLRQPRFGLFE